MNKRYQYFKDFYPFYLSQHQKRGTRILHFVGTSFFFFFMFLTIYTKQYWYLLAAIITPYSFAWLSHLTIEKNKPAAFSQPIFSLLGDFKLYFEIILGKNGWGK